MRVDTVCLQQFHQFIQFIRSCISTRRELRVRSYTQLQCHCLAATPSPCRVRSSRQRTAGRRLRRSSLSSREVRLENPNSKHAEQEANQNESPHNTHTDYILVSTGPSAPRMFPWPKCSNTLSRKRQRSWPRSDVNDVSDVSRDQAGPTLTLNMATSCPIPE